MGGTLRPDRNAPARLDEDFLARKGSPTARRALGERAFWAHYMRFGFMVMMGESLAICLYWVSSPRFAYRTLEIGIAASSFFVALALTFSVGRISASKYRVPFCLLVILGSGALLTMSCVLQAGFDSPLVPFLLIPMIAAVLALPPEAVIATGVAVIVEIVVIVTTDSDVRLRTGPVILLFSLVLGVLVLAVGSALARSRLQRDEDGLLQELAYLSEIDALTGCLNHGAFFQRLQYEIDRALRYHEQVSLIIGDIDLFKDFNDAHGHLAGDAALAAVGAALQRSSRSSDIVARVGGDEFAIILPHTWPDAAASQAIRVAGILEAEASVRITLSLGVASLDASEPTVRRLFRDADAALYEAKRAGRDRIHVAGIEPSEHLIENIELVEQQLRVSRRESNETKSILESLIEASPVGLVHVDLDHRIVHINSAIAEVVGRTASSMVGETVQDAFPDFWPILGPMLATVESQRETVVADVPGGSARFPGELRHWHSTVFPVSANGALVGVGSVVLDVTDEVRLEQTRAELTSKITSALAATSEVRDPYTAGHQGRVSIIASQLATALGHSEEFVREVGLAARLHDVGKVGIPGELLSRPGRLSQAELALVRTHAQIGFDLLSKVDLPEAITEMVHHHHERLDGSGYPDGLCGDAVSAGVRIIAVADVFEAMASRRPYRETLGVDSAVAALADGSGTLYDPEVVRTFMALFESGSIDLD